MNMIGVLKYFMMYKLYIQTLFDTLNIFFVVKHSHGKAFDFTIGQTE